MVHFVRFIRWHVVRYLWQRPLLAGLNVLSVAIGVAVFLAVQLANESAGQSFRSTIDFVAGKADLEIAGPSSDVPENLLPQVLRVPGVAAATLLVRGIVTLPDYPGEYLDVLGIDVFTNAPFRTFELGNADAPNFDRFHWLRGPNVIAVSDRFAADHNLKSGDKLRASVNGKRIELEVGFAMRGASGGTAGAHFAAMDIGWAQEMFGTAGKLNSIQIKTSAGASRLRVADRVRPLLPADIFVAPPQRRSEQIEKIVGSFQLNLTALSLVALFVGVFLIYNTISASVLRRRRELGVLRSLGVSTAHVTALFITEATLLASVGTLLGLVLGTLLARLLIPTVSHTISALYFLVDIRNLSANGAQYLAAVGVGLLSGIGAAWIPSRRAASLAIGNALRPEISVASGIRAARWNWIAITLISAGAISSWVALTVGPPLIGFAAAFFTLAGFSFFAPAFIRVCAHVVSSGARWARAELLSFPIASSQLVRSEARNAVTVAALASAVAMTIGVAVMIFSFRQTVGTWIDQTLVADVFVAPASNEITGPISFVPLDAIIFFEKDSRIATVDTFREQRVSMGGEPGLFASVRGNGPRIFPFLGGDGARLMRRFREERCVIVSEGFARRRKIAAGERLSVDTPTGSVSLPVIGVFYDYTRDEGVVFASTKTFVSLFHDERVNSLALYLNPGASAESITAAFRKSFAGAGEFAIYQNRDLRQRVFEIFDQTFAVTYVLQAVAIVVALTGTFLAFTTLMAERVRIVAIMRAVGMSAAQVARLLLIEAAMMGVIASALGIIAGLALAVVLTGVINRAFFGWTVNLSIPWRSLWTTPVWVVASAVAAAVIPAWRAVRARLSDGLRFE